MAEGGVPQALIASRCAVGLRSVEPILKPPRTLAELASGSRLTLLLAEEVGPRSETRSFRLQGYFGERGAKRGLTRRGRRGPHGDAGAARTGVRLRAPPSLPLPDRDDFGLDAVAWQASFAE